MEVRNRHFSCFFDQFTPNTYVMIVTPGCDMPKALVKRNIAHARDAIQLTLLVGCRDNFSDYFSPREQEVRNYVKSPNMFGDVPKLSIESPPRPVFERLEKESMQQQAAGAAANQQRYH